MGAGGLATGVGPGSTTITATVGHLSASAALTVEPAGGARARISAGRGAFSAHTCGVSTAGQAFCWGAGSSGQLGNGGTSDQLSPVAVAGSHRFASVSAGAFYGCGVTTGGEAYCWGRGTSGELGEGRTVNRSAPVRVSDPF